jgi:hypothetical protein
LPKSRAMSRTIADRQPARRWASSRREKAIERAQLRRGGRGYLRRAKAADFWESKLEVEFSKKKNWPRVEAHWPLAGSRRRGGQQQQRPAPRVGRGGSTWNQDPEPAVVASSGGHDQPDRSAVSTMHLATILASAPSRTCRLLRRLALARRPGCCWFCWLPPASICPPRHCLPRGLLGGSGRLLAPRIGIIVAASRSRDALIAPR